MTRASRAGRVPRRLLRHSVLAAAVGAGLAPAGWASTSNWTATVGGNWSDATWTAGAPGGSTATAAFNDPFHWANPSDATASLWPPYPGAYPAIMTLDANVTLAGLSIYSYTNMLLTSTGGQTLTLSGGGAGATVTTVDGVDGQGRHTIATGLVLSDNVTFQTNAANGAVWLTGLMNSFSGTTNVTKAGPGTLLLGGANTFRGTINVTAGTLQIANDGNLGDSANVIGLSSGARLLSTGSYTLGASRTITLGTGGGTIEESGSGTTLTIGGTNQLLGSGDLTKAGAGTLSVTAGETFSGGVAVSGGKLSLSGAGALLSATGFTVSPGATLELANASGTNNNNRIGTVGVTLAGGTLSLTTDGTTSEGFGALTASSGFSTVSETGSGTLTAGSLGAVGTTAAVNFVGTALGSTTKIILTGVSAGAMGRWATAGGADWAVYDTTNGVKAMVSGTTGNDYATTITASRHVKLAASNTAIGSTSIYSLVLASGINAGTSSGQTLTLSQGAILKAGTTASALSGTVSSPSDFFVYTDAGSTLNVSAALTASGGLAKNGTGALSLSASNTGIGGNVTVNAGTLTISNANALNQRPVTVGPGATFGTSGVSYSTGIAGGFTNNGLVTVPQGYAMTFTGQYSGSGELRGSEAKSTLNSATYATLAGRGFWFADGRNDNAITGPVTVSDSTNGWQLLGATGTGTVLTFNGTMTVGSPANNTGEFLAAGAGGKIVIGANAQINNNMPDLINARPFRILGDGVATATVEFADGFKADHTGYEGVYADYVSGGGGIWATNGLSTVDMGDVTIITNSSDNLPSIAKRAGTTGAPMTHHGLWWCDLGSSAKWIVQTHDQEYDGGIRFTVPVEINTQTNLRNAGYYHDAARVAWYHSAHNVTVRKTGPGTLAIDMTQSYVSGSVMQIEAGRVEYNTDPADSSLVTIPYQSPETSGTTKYVIDNHLQVKAIAAGASFSFGPRADGATLYRTWQGDVSGGGLGIVATGKTWQTGGLSVSSGAGMVQVDGTGLASVLSTTVTVSQDTSTLVYSYATNASFSLASGTTLTKTGTGTLQISAGVTQSYTGTPVINVNGGAFRADSTTVTSTHTPTVNVNSTGTLQGIGTLPDAGTVNINNGGTLSPGNGGVGTITLGSLTLNASGAINADFSSGTLDKIIVSHSGGLNIAGATTVNITNISGLVAGQYTLIDYPATGGFSGSLSNLTIGTVTGGPTGVTYSFVNNTSNTSIDLLVTTAANLTWKGTGTSSNWDINTTANWNSNTLKYNQGDNVTFDDTGTAGTVNLTATVNPGSLTVSNPTKAYTFSGAGGFAGNFVLTKQGAAALTIGTTNSGFTGSVALSAGTLQLTSATAINGRPVTMTGGTLNLRNDSAINYASSIAQSGTGTINFGTSSGGAGAGLIWQMGDLSTDVGSTLTITNSSAAAGACSALLIGNLLNKGTIKTSPYTGLTVAGTYTDNGAGTGNFLFTGKVDPANLNSGVSFRSSATLRGQFSQESDAYKYPALGANGASTVVNFQGNWVGDGGTTYNYMFLQNGGKVLFGNSATIDLAADSSGFARQLWCYADSNAGNTIELDAGFVADKTVYPGSSAPSSYVSSGSIRFEAGVITLITNASQSLPILTRWRTGVAGPNGHIVFDNPGTYTWQVKTASQTYIGMVQLKTSATIQTDQDLTIAGTTFSWDDYTACNGLYNSAGGVTLTKTGPATLSLTGDQTWNTGAVLQINNGTVAMTTNPGTDPTAGHYGTTSGYGGQHLTANVAGASSSINFGAATHSIVRLDLSSGATARLMDLAGGPSGSHTLQTTNLSVSAGAGNLFTDAGGSATVSGTGATFTLAAGATLNKTGAGTLTINGTQTHGATSALNVGGGIVNLNTDAGSSTTANVALAISSGRVNLGAGQHLRDLTLPGGILDLVGNSVVVRNSTLGLGSWSGSAYSGLLAEVADHSILTSLADANHGVAIMTAQQAHDNGNPAIAGSTDILVQYAYNGDLNLDGNVNYLDYGVIDNAYLSHAAPTYAAGDVNLDGAINYLDYGMLDNAFLAQSAPHTASTSAAAAVPEPAAGLLLLSVLAFLPRRRARD